MATILVVDDSRFQHAFLRNALEPAGYAVLTAGNGREALEVLEEETPDCIVADLIMPEMRGITLLETLRAQGSTIPTIVLTADIQTQVRERCLNLGALAVLHKPVKAERLRDTIAEALAGKNGTAEKEGGAKIQREEAS